jgi:hypothetical protein
MSPVWNRTPLAPAAFARLPFGAVHATGWLREQLRLSAAGLTGHMMEIWEDVGPSSGWLGGAGENWERGPYYVRGLVALAHLRADPRLLELVTPWIEWTLASQRADGFFGPPDNRDWWPRMPMLEALRWHYEATADARIIPFLLRYTSYQLGTLPEQPLTDWGRPRGGDNLDTVLWLFNVTGESFLLDLADLVHAQTSDWIGELGGNERPNEGFEFGHGVNRAMGFKEPAIYWQRSHREADLSCARTGWERTLAHHGQIQGTFSSDEFLHGRGPTQGAELCAVVETISSLATVFRISGEPWAADAIERLGYNALPAMLTPDHCGHQYFAQPNQVSCTPGPHRFQIHHENDLLFGPVTGYGCCAANFHMGWPLVVNHLWMATADGGLIASLFAPCTVTATVGNGQQITISEDTTYPFADEVRFTVHGQRPVTFPLSVRLPAWAARAALVLNGTPLRARPTAQRRVVLARTWHDGDTLTVKLPMRIRISHWNGAVGVERGPLVYALRIGEEWRPVAGTPPFADHEVHPTTPWNYGLLLNPRSPGRAVRVEHGAVSSQPWSQDGAGIRLRVRGARIPAWQLVDGDCGPVPAAPAADSPAEWLTLIPFGCARLRIALFPPL